MFIRKHVVEWRGRVAVGCARIEPLKSPSEKRNDPPPFCRLSLDETALADFDTPVLTPFNAGSASEPVGTRAFGGVHVHRTTRWRESRAQRPSSSGEGAPVSFPCPAPFRSLSGPWPRS